MVPALDVPKKDSRSWDALTPPLAEWILDAVAAMGFRQMTPVQAATLPQFLAHKDVVVEAVTGSGKTLAYLIPAVQRLVRLDEPTKRHHVGSIVVSPTRELAAQIHTVLLSLLRFHAPSAELLPYLAGEEKRPATTVPVVVPQLLVGGSNTPAQDLGFFLRHSPNLLVASPGRLVELLSSPHIHCTQSSFDVLILDEADRLLDLGFKNDITGIISRLPKQRRTGLFSASVSEAVAEIIRVGLRNPVKIQVRVRMSDGSILEDRKVPASLQMTYIITRASQKLPALSQLLTRLLTKPQRSIVFLSTCAAVDYFQHVLPCLLPVGYSLISLHGKHMAKVRQKNFDRFLTSVSPTILLTTDLAARGLDIHQVDLVVQVDPPSDPKVFIHRSGRAGRAGRKGLAVIMLHPGPEEDYVRFLEVRKTPITRLEKPRVQVSEDEAGRATQTIRKMVSQDRALYDKAQKAFVSWVRSYGAHQAASIFLTSGLDWADLGHAWGLLRMPRMPELKGWQGDKTLGVDMEWDGFAYRDQDRERARLEALEAETSGPALDLDKAGELGRKRRNKNEAWSGKLENEEVRAERREKRSKKREAKKLARMTPAERAKQLELDHLVVLVREKNLQARAEAAAAIASGSQHDEFEGFD